MNFKNVMTVKNGREDRIAVVAYMVDQDLSITLNPDLTPENYDTIIKKLEDAKNGKFDVS